MDKNQEEKDWEALLADIEKHRGKKRLKKVGKNVISIVLFIVILSSFGFLENQITALRLHFFEIISQDGGQVQYGWLPEEFEEELEEELILPEYLPPGYDLDELDIIDKTPENYHVILIFTDGDHQIRLIQEKVSEGAQKSVNLGEASVETKNINGNEGMIAFHENGYITVLFIDSKGIEHTIMGEIEKEELIKLAESLN